MKNKYNQADLVRLKGDKSKKIFYILSSEGESIYTIINIDDITDKKTVVKEDDLEVCTDKVEFTITIKGELPQGLIDKELQKKYADVKMKYGSVMMHGTKADFDKFYNETIAPLEAKSGIKVIGINFKSIKKLD